MEIEFECGHTAKSVGMIGMALQAHVGQCDVAACQDELPGLIAQYKNV